MLRRGCNCGRNCKKSCPKPALFVQRVKAVYNGRLITKNESDRIRKSEKEQFGGAIDTTEDSTAVATIVMANHLKGTEVGRSMDQDFKKQESGLEGADDDMLSKKSKKRTKQEAEDSEAEDGDAKSMRVMVCSVA